MPEEDTKIEDMFEKPAGSTQVENPLDVSDSLHDKEDPVEFDKKVRKVHLDPTDMTCPDSPHAEK